MIDLTPEAKRKFDHYLQRVRVSLRGTRAVEAEEVEQNVVEHVELALAGAAGPVGAEQLGAVLEQLGPPERWLPEEERPWWRKAMDRAINGPEDWRLAWAAFALTLLAILFLPIGVGFLLIVPAFLLSRAYVALLADRGEPLGARRWLVLPPIAAVLVLVCAVALFAPVAGIGDIAYEEGVLRAAGLYADTRLDRIRINTGFVALAAGAWWIVLSGVFALLMRPFRVLFEPLTSNLRRVHALALTAAGVVVGAIGAALLFAT